MLGAAADLIEKLKQTAVELGPAMQKIVHSLTKLRAELEAVHHRPHTSGEVATIQVRLGLRIFLGFKSKGSRNGQVLQSAMPPLCR